VRADQFHSSAARCRGRTGHRSQRRLFWIWWDKTVKKHGDDPFALLDALLVGAARQIKQADYRSCPFLNTATEFPDNTHPGRVVARANKDELRTRLTALCTRIGVANPERVEAQLFLLINGAYAAGQMRATPTFPAPSSRLPTVW